MVGQKKKVRVLLRCTRISPIVSRATFSGKRFDVSDEHLKLIACTLSDGKHVDNIAIPFAI